jgi:hypothetical protein
VHLDIVLSAKWNLLCRVLIICRHWGESGRIVNGGVFPVYQIVLANGREQNIGARYESCEQKNG